MPAEIRPARASDVDDLAAIENAAFSGDRISRKSFRRLIGRDTAAVLVAERDGGIAGYCAVLFRSSSQRPRLYSVAVKPGIAGLGRSLLAAAEDAARERGKAFLRLEVRADNVRAIEIYEKAGFRRIGSTEGYYDDGMTAIRYEKALVTVASQSIPTTGKLRIA